MKINKKVKEELINNMKVLKKDFNDLIDNSIIEIEESKQVEDMIENKQWLLKNMLLQLPLGNYYCYFCLLKTEEDAFCNICEYGKIHKICIDDDSDFQKILEKRNDFINAIDIYYYNEDIYK